MRYCAVAVPLAALPFVFLLLLLAACTQLFGRAPQCLRYPVV
jgi:hypothetical protein